MPTVETLASQARRMQLTEGEDFVVKTYTNRLTNQKVQVLELTEHGKIKKGQLADTLFPPSASAVSVPLGENSTITQLHEGDILDIDGLLALSLIRRRTGGYVCSFTDNFSTLKAEKYRTRIQHIDADKNSVRILFDHWPGEYHNYEYFVEKPNLTSVNEPISVGPECVIDFQILKDGRPHENLLGWAKNAIKRNLLGQK